MTTFEILTPTQKSRAALLRDVQAISTEACHFLGLEITKPAMEIVAELVFKKLSVYGTDLEAFAKHAKRSTVNTEDVKLLVRRCPSLKAHLNTIAPTAPSSKEKKRKTIAGVRQPESPAPKPKEQEQSLKQKEKEIPKRYPEIVASTSKEEKIDEVESMITDDVIDLRFDD